MFEKENKRIRKSINSFLQKQESPEKLSENVEHFMEQKILPLYKKKRITLDHKSASSFFEILEDEMKKCNDPLYMIKYLSLMSNVVEYFDKIFLTKERLQGDNMNGLPKISS